MKLLVPAVLPGELGRFQRATRTRNSIRYDHWQTSFSSHLAKPLAHSAEPSPQLIRHIQTFGRYLGMQLERSPGDPYLVIVRQLFGPNLAEVTPGSEIVGENDNWYFLVTHQLAPRSGVS